MRARILLIGLAATGLIAASSVPASAQLDDFLCSTFNYKCEPPPAPPPPALAPEAAAPPAEPVKHAKRVHKHKVKAAKAKAKAESEAAAPAAAAPAAPAAPDAAK